jgi:hypothetical protein
MLNISHFTGLQSDFGITVYILLHIKHLTSLVLRAVHTGRQSVFYTCTSMYRERHDVHLDKKLTITRITKTFEKDVARFTEVQFFSLHLFL